MPAVSAFPGLIPDESVDGVAHLIQTALTPVFMLSGIGTLLNMFNTRLARVSDRIESVRDKLESTEDKTGKDARALLRRLALLHYRTLLLDAAILFGGVGGASACGSAFALFLGSVRDSAVAWWLVLMFGNALVCTVIALGMFLGDSIVAWHGLRVTIFLPHKRDLLTAITPQD
ncbi:DUF2721 domain-containing protein [Komagataeibacter rhaeticus]|uniref:DUF2721 domain-containing protein n=1 Tax=Komagataeibacter rhaeticus TaxID=215221 RepID=A0A858JIW0_9PROT|nr:DUF2721 domain-containing protein [Komagataeibacter rhaeticus]ATU74038.1 DUF2721 domain-containing protein [Komagataeibacter xylinus]KDU97590.1 hypothetical protein GLUCORHAEAF1_16535 [Komagataeibacter rhaeticus AF1]MBL7240876.1 DUF2721 domain-containing protein [Komagataeibacter rhaeticus]PYD54883.1 DUF2721 domain-containing protein [Komagataeibacter rhaeticus]QIP36516.1 DUF2721 domain-containing protein [Komagataeibacter rhaeticus]